VKNAVVLGSGRSGTSMLAGTIAGAGYFVGEEPYAGRASNEKGFFEAQDVNGVNERLIASVEARGGDLGAWQRWLAQLPVGQRFDVPSELRERMRRLVSRAPFCFKDPRFCYTLPAWRDVFGETPEETRYLVVFREPAATARSMVQECRSADYLCGLEFGFERGVDVWTAMYRHVLETHRHQGSFLFVHFDQLLAASGLDRVERFLEAKIARNFPEERLKHARADAPVSAEAARLYGELCRLAGHDGAPVSVSVAAAPSRTEVSDSEPELSVILCTFNRREVLAESVPSFENQTAAPGSYELIVVDDGSSDGTREWLQSRGLRCAGRVVHRENGGLSAARNSGIAVARGRRLLLVNDDTIAFPDLVEQHLRASRELGDEAVAIQGTFEQPPRALDNALMRMLERSTEVFCYAGMKPRAFHDWNRFWTCNVSVSRKLVLAAGGLDESFRHYGCEDTDLAIRLQALGGRVWFHDGARAHHRHLLDFDALKRRQLQVARAWVRLFQKHPTVLEHEDWAWVRTLDLEACERFADERNPHVPALEAAARVLCATDVGALDGEHAALQGTADTIVERLRTIVAELNRIWWHQGFAAGLVEHGRAGFEEILPVEPWPLATQGRAVVAWPTWEPLELERLLREFGASLSTHADASLVLRHDFVIDPPLAEAQQALSDAYYRVLGSNAKLDVLMLDDLMSTADAIRLGRAVDGALQLPSSTSEPRRTWLERLGASLVHDGNELESLLSTSSS